MTIQSDKRCLTNHSGRSVKISFAQSLFGGRLVRWKKREFFRGIELFAEGKRIAIRDQFRGMKMNKVIPLQIALIMAVGGLGLPPSVLAQAAPDASGSAAPAADSQAAPQTSTGAQGVGGGQKRHHRNQGAGALTGQDGGSQEDRRAARRAKMLKRFDKNGDGQLDDSEKAAMKDFMQQMRAKRQARMGGAGAGNAGKAAQGGADSASSGSTPGQ